MHLLKALALCPLAAQAAVLARQDCAATATVTVTPSPITQVQEIYTNAGKATTTATRYALLSSSSSPSASPVAARDEQKVKNVARQCPAAAATTTITLPASTVTTTSTVTYTKATRATATAAACQPANNYGLVRGTLNLNQNAAALQVQRFPALDSIAACCAACFTSEQGCLAWSFGGSVTNGAAEDGCVMSLASAAGCPSSSGTEVIVYENDAKPLVGVGGCDVQVKAF